MLNIFKPKPWSIVQTALNHNRKMRPWVLTGGAVIMDIPTQGVLIHRLRPVDAEAISVHVKVIRGRYNNVFGVPLMLAFMGLESFFDPNAVNENGKPRPEAMTRRGLIGDFAGDPAFRALVYRTLTDPADWDRSDKGNWDVGLCQLKLRYVVGDERTDTINVSEAYAFAMDIADSVEQKTRIMIDAWLAAKKFIRENPEYEWVGHQRLGIESYQSGRTGAQQKLIDGKPFTYAPKVIALEREFAKRLQLPSEFDAPVTEAV